MQPLRDVTPTHQNSNNSSQHGTEQGRQSEVKYPTFLQVPWRGRDIVWGVLVGLGLLGALAVMLSLGLSLFLRARGESPGMATGLVTLLAEVALLLPVWWFGVGKYRLPWSSVGLRPFAPARGLGLGCLLLPLALSFNVVWSLFLSFFGLRTQPDLLPLFGGGIGGLLLALLSGGLIAPFAEEVFFRGFVFAGLGQRFGLRRALVLSAMLFAVVHILPTSWPPIFVLGLVFALLYEQTGSIWPAVAAHGVINSISFLALYLVQVPGH